MTPRSLREHINDLPESLLDVDIEFAIDFKVIKEDDGKTYGVREDCYIGGILMSEEEKTVILTSQETLNKMTEYFTADPNVETVQIEISDKNTRQSEIQ